MKIEPWTMSEKIDWIMRDSSSPVFLELRVTLRGRFDGGVDVELWQRCHDCDGTDQEHVDELHRAHGDTLDESLNNLIVAMRAKP